MAPTILIPHRPPFHIFLIIQVLHSLVENSFYVLFHMLFVTAVVEGKVDFAMLDFFAQKSALLDEFGRLIAAIATLSEGASRRVRTYCVVVAFYFFEK